MKYLTFQEYFNWTVNEVIHIEFLRNMSLALLCVFLLTLIMLADLKLCAMVFVCVLFTLARTKRNREPAVNLTRFVKAPSK